MTEELAVVHFSGFDVPEADGLVVAAGGYDCGVRHPGYDVDTCEVTFECVAEFAGACLPDLNCCVTRYN